MASYQSPYNQNSIGVSGPGFASRGKAGHIKRLSVQTPSISAIDETQQMNNVSTPRTARGHLLAGLRTAPKSAVPTSNGLDQSRFAPQYNNGQRLPQTSASAFFPQSYNNNSGYQSFQEQVLAPPSLDFGGHDLEGSDAHEYETLRAQNRALAEQSLALQQQVAMIQNKFSALNINTGYSTSMAQYQSPVNPALLYQQQLQQSLQPVVTPIAGSPGLYSVYNPMTGQQTVMYDNAVQQQADQYSADAYRSVSPPQSAPVFQRQTSDSSDSRTQLRSVSPPKTSQSPATDVEPLPPPSANAFRRGHRKNMSSANIKTTGEWTRNGVGPRSAGVPQTPATGTFGPGHGRVGAHPSRQPKNPPLLNELEEKPTSKHDSSKNFAARQRRQAVHDLVKAGRERRNDVKPGSGSGTPASEGEFNFSASGSDTDSVLAGSTTLTSRTSMGSIGMGAIGSERKGSCDRSSVDSLSSRSQ
ncbi:uncharacterized protein AB675_4865 [Cyphellophora attinorum]|uniref:Uncharacterized protein n=1 Tax=Cyphellophora attinorum TaxID=1664694 RepID=A0A0N1HGY1_9EURO|nr:uncharacterized protein AB675_4865 [Phialophora attinorum]KPI34843.1 hypothetical protein AB675_4865 [Phialophora attinorum]